MVIVFSNVVADISSEFLDKFPNGRRVDFLGVLRGVCEDAKVELISDITIASEYKLKGSWELISKAYYLLRNLSLPQQNNSSCETGTRNYVNWPNENENRKEFSDKLEDFEISQSDRKSSGKRVQELDRKCPGKRIQESKHADPAPSITSECNDWNGMYKELDKNNRPISGTKNVSGKTLPVLPVMDGCGRMVQDRKRTLLKRVNKAKPAKCLQQRRKKHSVVTGTEISECQDDDYTLAAIIVSDGELNKPTPSRCLRQRKMKPSLGNETVIQNCYKHDHTHNLLTNSSSSNQKCKKERRKMKNILVQEVSKGNNQQTPLKHTIKCRKDDEESTEDGNGVNRQAKINDTSETDKSAYKIRRKREKNIIFQKVPKHNNQKSISVSKNKLELGGVESTKDENEAAVKDQSLQEETFDDDKFSNTSMQKDNEDVEHNFIDPQNQPSTKTITLSKLSSVNRRKRFGFSRPKFPSIKRQLSNSLLTRSLLLKKRGRPRKYCSISSKYHCPDCDFVAKTRNALGDHKHRIHLAKPTKCNVCEKVFPNLRYMKRHQASHVEPQHCCDICGKMYKILKALRDHRKTHDEDYERPEFPCSQCSKKFCTRYIMECHFKSEHLGQKRSFLCSTCGKSFTTKHTLQQHLNVHSGVKPYSCDKCKKSFSYESALRDHKYIHDGEKNFVCGVCDKAFRQRSALKMHEKIHREKKEFACDECGRGFTQKQALQRHERAHKGLKPFSCKLCGRTFGDASIIRRHMILVHKINKDPSIWREDIIMKTPKTGENEMSPLEHAGDDEIAPVPIQIFKNTCSRVSRKSTPKVRTNTRNTSDVNMSCNKSSKKIYVQEPVVNDPVENSATASVNMPSVLPIDNLFQPIPPSMHTAPGSSSIQTSLYSMEMNPHVHNIDYQYPNAHNMEHSRTFPYVPSTANQIVDPRYQRIPETTTTMNQDDINPKRLHDTEPPDNLSISSLYAYYTNLASQYINVNSYSNYVPNQEHSNQEHQ